MIKGKKPVSMCEAGEILKSIKETDKTNEVKSFIKSFSKTGTEKSKKLKATLEELEMIKLKQADIVKIVDLLPEDATELNKIFTDIVLDADETNKILGIVKNNI